MYKNKSGKSLSVLIVTKGRWHFLRRCLLSLAKQKEMPDEVVVVINTPEKIPQRLQNFLQSFPEFSVAYENRPGIPFARNRALATSHSSHVFFLDDDCFLLPNTIRELKKAWQANSPAAAIQGRVLNAHSGKLIADVAFTYYQDWVKRSRRKKTVTILDTKAVGLAKKKLPSPKPFQAFWAPYACGEDQDLAERIVRNGEKIVYAPKVTVYHAEPVSLKAFLDQRWRHGRMQAQWQKEWGKTGERTGKQKWQFFKRWHDTFGRTLKDLVFSGMVLLLGWGSYRLGYLRERLRQARSEA